MRCGDGRVARWLAALLLIASAVSGMAASPATPSYAQQRFIARGSELRVGPAPRNDSDSLRQPYPSRFYGDVSRGIKGCSWLMDRAIRTNNKNIRCRYRKRACASVYCRRRSKYRIA